jgi:hypothetical protein
VPPARRQKVALVVLIGGMGALAMAGAIGAVFDDPPVQRATTTTTTAPPVTVPKAAGFGPAGQELDVLTDAGRHVDHAAVYEVDDPELPEGLVQTVEIWRKGGLFRNDVVERTGRGTRRQSWISGGPVLRQCITDVDSVQTCETVDSVPNDLAAVFVLQLHEAKTEGKDVELVARDDDVAGYVARCYEAKGVGELCVAGDGVMLRLKLKQAVIELTRLEDVVPDTAFDTAG